MRKRITAGLMAVAMVLCLAACGSSGPDAPVKAFCEGMKNWDTKAMAAACEGGKMDEDPFDGADESSKTMIDFFKKYSKELKYTVKESKTEGDTATITVEFQYKDTSETLQAAVSALFVIAIQKAGSGEDFGEKEAMAAFSEGIATAEGTTPPKDATATVTFKAKKSGNDWKLVDLDEEVITVWTCNGLAAFGSLFGN